MRKVPERKIQISLPEAVYAWLTDRAESNFVPLAQQIRQEIIEAYRREPVFDVADGSATHVVYFVRAGKEGPVQVGASSDFTRRYSELQANHAAPIDVIGLIYYASRREAFDFEQVVKQRFKMLKLKDNWLKPTSELLAFMTEQVERGGTRAPVLTSTTSTSTSPLTVNDRKPRDTRSGFKGVYPYGKRWAAVSHEGGRKQRLGVYDTPEDAARAYDQHLIARSGDPHAAVNFPHGLDELRDASAPFVERFASGQVNDIEWKAWQDATKGHAVPERDGPMPVLPPSAAKVTPSMPLIDRPAKSLYKRDMPPPTPLVRPDPVPAEPDEDLPDGSPGGNRVH